MLLGGSFWVTYPVADGIVPTSAIALASAQLSVSALAVQDSIAHGAPRVSRVLVHEESVLSSQTNSSGAMARTD